MKGIKQQTLPQALWNLDRIDKRSSALDSVYRRACFTSSLPAFAHGHASLLLACPFWWHHP